MSAPGWGSWLAGAPAAVLHPATGAVVALGGYGSAANAFTSFPYDPACVRLGPRGPEGRYAELELAHAGARLRLRWAAVGADALVAELSVVEAGEWGLRRWHVLALGRPDGAGEAALERPEGAAAYVEPPLALLRAGEDGAVALLPAERPVGAALYDDWTESAGELERAGYYFRPPERSAGRWAVLRANAVEPRLGWAVAAAGDAEGARAAAREALARADEALEEGRREAGRASPRRAAVRDVVGWNTVWHPDDGRPYTATTRAWVEARFGGAIVWLMDAWVHVMLAAHLGDWETARWNVEVALGNRTEAGALAALRSPLTFWQDRSHPPLGALAVWDLHARTGERELLERAYPVLLGAHEWWFSHRDPNADGLLEYGSSPVGDGHFVHTRLAAMDESAMDNSPVFDGAAFDLAAHTLDAADVGLNALVALEGELLAGMAAALGRGAECRRMRERSLALGARVRERLWDPEREVFANRGWDGRFARSLAPTSFYPLLAGIASPEQARRLVREHLLDTERFWTPMPVAGTPADDPAAEDNTYWRGRAWPPFNLLVFRGLRRYGFDGAAGALAARGLDAWEHHWAQRRSWENLNQFTGAGGDSPDSDPFYTWGALLAALPDWELIDLTPWDGLSFGAPGAARGEADLLTAAGSWTCRVGPGATELAGPGGLWLRLGARGRVRDVHRAAGELSMEVPGRMGPVELRVRLPDERVAEARLADAPVPIAQAEADEARLELPAGEAGRLVLTTRG